jgi:hypothetical protein
MPIVLFPAVLSAWYSLIVVVSPSYCDDTHRHLAKFNNNQTFNNSIKIRAAFCSNWRTLHYSFGIHLVSWNGRSGAKESQTKQKAWLSPTLHTTTVMHLMSRSSYSFSEFWSVFPCQSYHQMTSVRCTSEAEYMVKRSFTWSIRCPVAILRSS